MGAQSGKLDRILDIGCTSSARAEKDVDLFHDTGQPLHKVFMLLDKTKIKATNKMERKLNLCKGASMNTIPHLHSTLISIPKMADNGYIAVFKKEKASIYNAITTTISASTDPILVAPPK
jgi:hypothetical protein